MDMFPLSLLSLIIKFQINLYFEYLIMGVKIKPSKREQKIRGSDLELEHYKQDLLYKISVAWQGINGDEDIHLNLRGSRLTE